MAASTASARSTPRKPPADAAVVPRLRDAAENERPARRAFFVSHSRPATVAVPALIIALQRDRLAGSMGRADDDQKIHAD